MRSTRHLICLTALALTVFTQLLLSQTPVPHTKVPIQQLQPKPVMARRLARTMARIRTAGARQFADQRIVRDRPKELPRNAVMGATASAVADEGLVHITAA